MTVLDDVAMFGAAHIASDDVDPIYPVLRWLYDAERMDDEQRLWATILYTTYYNLTSGLQAFDAMPTAGRLPETVTRFPTGVERRGLRGGLTGPFIDGFIDALAGQSIKGWLTQSWGDDPVVNYLLLWDTWQTVKGNGRWSAFKIAEVLRRVHGFNIIAPDMRLKFCTGPLEGLRWMFPHGVSDDHRAKVFREAMIERGVDEDWEHLETVLCDFNSMRKGHYYVGHDIDQMQEQIAFAPAPIALRLREARHGSLPQAYLGELNGWNGRSAPLAKSYRDTGVMGDRAALAGAI